MHFVLFKAFEFQLGQKVKKIPDLFHLFVLIIFAVPVQNPFTFFEREFFVLTSVGWAHWFS